MSNSGDFECHSPNGKTEHISAEAFKFISIPAEELKAYINYCAGK